MSLAVKNPETSSPGRLDRLHVGVLAGVLFVVGSLAVVFHLLPRLWWQALGDPPQHTAVATTLLVVVGLALVGALGFVGRRLLGPQPTPGIKAGIFTALVTLLVIVLVTRWASTYFENWTYDHTLPGGETFGIALTVALGVVLLILAGRFLFLAPGFGPKMVAFEEQGWFSTTSIKRSQGQRVRRGTMLAILVVVGCGIYSLDAHKTLVKYGDWALNVPFTGQEKLEQLNDAAITLPPNVKVGDTIDLGTFRTANEQLSRDYVKLDEDVRFEDQNGPQKYTKGQVISQKEYKDIHDALVKQRSQDPNSVKTVDPTTRTPEAAKGTLSYKYHLTLLPDVRYTLPILLAALALWFAWRIVNVPGFADFLIATEAELNKVSWTTRRRLVQDTIVVLVTVVLFTIFLFVVDVAWGRILSWKAIGVLKIPESGAKEESRDQSW